VSLVVNFSSREIISSLGAESKPEIIKSDNSKNSIPIIVRAMSDDLESFKIDLGQDMNACLNSREIHRIGVAQKKNPHFREKNVRNHEFTS
jgi:hypothetical protein